MLFLTQVEVVVELKLELSLSLLAKVGGEWVVVGGWWVD